MKPAVDMVVAAICLILFLPLLIAVAILIRTTMGPGVIYRQVRVGHQGRPFTIYKFRTMLSDRRSYDSTILELPVGVDRRISHKRADDPRHTPIGRVIRKFSVDELPQLWNVIKGDMSLVGPRPELVGLVSHYEPWQHRRHDVKPGLTGLWQVTARGTVELHEATAIDLDYVDRLSAATDLKIVLATFPAVLMQRAGR